MNSEDKARFEKTLVEITEAMGGRTPSKQTVARWWDAMSDMTIEQFESAMAQYFVMGERPPLPFLVRRAVGMEGVGYGAGGI